MSEHCHKCCERYGIGMHILAGAFIFALAYSALSYFAPDTWTVGQRLAATFILVGLFR